MRLTHPTRFLQTTLFCATLFGVLMTSLHASTETSEATPWHITGDFSEACSCSVPCACNFGQSPSPHMFCWALFSFTIEQGNYGDVSLDGLKMAGANGAKGGVWYIDERATKEQADALKKIATTCWLSFLKANGFKSASATPPEMRLLAIKRARLEQAATEKRAYMKIVGAGGFDADYIMGIDGKTPVIVENNYSWNIQHGIKAKTHQMTYRDSFGNQFTFKQTNSNQGKFDWSDTTPLYFR